MKIKSISPVGKHNVYDISVKDVHHYTLCNGVLTHNSSITYASNQIFVITKSQEKEGTDVVGWNFTINIEKSRYVREKSKLKFTVKYESGIDKYSGLLEIAIESGHVIKPSQGWYSRVNKETGETEEKKWRAKDTNTSEFWDQVLESESFKTWIESRYKISYNTILSTEI